jgi:CubicO group peptidase (beta-lactamase class C family)
MKIARTAFAVIALAGLLSSCKRESSTGTHPPASSQGASAKLASAPTQVPAPAPGPAPATAPVPALAVERMASDAPRTTTKGATFIAPAGWSLRVSGPVTILEPPEGQSAIALVNVVAPSADAAVAEAWKAYKPQASWPLKVVNKKPDKDGWTDRRSYEYQTSPNEKRDVGVETQRAGDVWTVAVYDMAQAVGEKRLAQVVLIFDRLFPKGHQRESFAGKKAHRLDDARLAELSRFVETAMKETGVPGVALGVIQDAKVVLSRGLGVRQLGDAKKVDADTLFMIASNTKAMTTLMLAKLVDERKLTWETPVTSALPSFKLGDAATTRKVRVKHLICACTGLPRQDFEWLFEFAGVTPERAMAVLGTMQPTTGFGEIFQYSNPLAAAGGFVGGHVAFPDLELGAAYDRAIQTRVFDPLHMNATTFDYSTALRGNHAMPHSPNIDGRPVRALMEVNYAVIPVRPAGAAWSNVRDVLAYIAMELAEGVLPGGERYISKEVLLARRAPQVAIGKEATYGMGLMVDSTYGIPVVHHGGDVTGFHSDMIWLPQHGVGAVVLTNGDPGWIIRGHFRRKLLEVLFDGRAEADAQTAAAAKTYYARIAAERKLVTVPADPAAVSKLAKRYRNPVLGEIGVSRDKGATLFDFGEWRSEVASRKNPDGTTSFLTIGPGVMGFEFVVGVNRDKRRSLTVRDAQHEYVFNEG